MRKAALAGWLTLVITALFFLAGCASGMQGGRDRDVRTKSDETTAQKRALNHLQLAIEDYKMREFNPSLDELKQALKDDPDLADAYSVRGLVYMEMGENHLAEDNFEQALGLDPNNPDFSNNYGLFLCRNGRPAESIRYFEATEKSRTYATPALALSNAGDCSLKLHDDAAAEKFFLLAFKRDPSNIYVSNKLAKICYDRHDYEMANFYITRVIKADVHDADVLWTAVKISHKLGDRLAEAKFGSELAHFQPDSLEYSRYQRGAFDD